LSFAPKPRPLSAPFGAPAAAAASVGEFQLPLPQVRKAALFTALRARGDLARDNRRIWNGEQVMRLAGLTRKESRVIGSGT
jgi:hypothetical protein